MNNKTLERIISKERLSPYLAKHNESWEKALEHYKANIRISESFYSGISILEIGLRNNIDLQLRRRYQSIQWFDEEAFIKDVTSFQIDKIQDARKTILKEKQQITPGKLIAELPFGFWTSLFDSRFERILWKDLRLAFPRCPKVERQRRNVSSKLNSIRKLRNRIFHHESIAWSYNALIAYKVEILEGIDWLNGDLTEYFSDTIRIEEVLINQKKHIEY